MATAFNFAIGILLLQTFVYGKENATKETSESKILSPSLLDLDNKNITNTQEKAIKNKETTSVNNQDDQGRQKRGYDLNGFPLFPSTYPSDAFRNDFSINGAYGQEDPYVQIHKRLRDIAAIIRQPTIPPMPPATRYPIFLPLLYLPTTNCRCSLDEDKRPAQPNPTQPKPTQIKPTQPTLPSSNIPNIPSRGPEIIESVNGSFIENEKDFSRPISFDPIPPIPGMKRQPPPVEHGSVEGEIKSNNSVGATSTLPSLVNRNATRNIPSFPTPDLPTSCDKAIISCCHQVTTTYNCFANQGCPDPSLYGNPCDTTVILKVIERLQKFYARKNNHS